MNPVLLPLAVITIVGVIGTVVSLKLKLPPVLGLLLVGAIAGPYMLGAEMPIETYEIMEQVGELGAILLLFTIGIEFSISRLLKGGLKIFLVFLAKVAIVFVAGYQAMLITGFTHLQAIYVGVMLSITSTALFLKILEQNKLLKRKEVPLLIGTLILEDLFAVTALTFFSQLNTNEEISGGSIIGKLFLSFIILIILYFVISWIVSKVMDFVTENQSEETFAFFGLGLCFGMAFIADSIGLAATVGAFLAGSIVAKQNKSKIFEKEIKPFTLVFVSMFFLSIGMQVNPGAILQNGPLVFMLIIVAIVSAFFGRAVSAYFLAGMKAESAVFSGLAVIPVGEFSLLIAREASATGMDFVSVTAGVIFGTAIVMSFAITKSEPLSDFISSRITGVLRQRLEYISYRLTISIDKFMPGGRIYNSFAKKRFELAKDAFAIIVLWSVLSLAQRFSPEIFAISPLSFGPNITLYAFAVSFIVLVMGGIVFKHLKDIADLFITELLKEDQTNEQMKTEQKGFTQLIWAFR